MEPGALEALVTETDDPASHTAISKLWVILLQIKFPGEAIWSVEFANRFHLHPE